MVFTRNKNNPSKKKMYNVAVLIPCYNEAKGIADVIKKMPYKRAARNRWNLQVYVIDNNSTDNTAEVAEAAGAQVLREPKKRQRKRDPNRICKSTSRHRLCGHA